MSSLIIQNIRRALDHDGYGVFTDLQKAFDNHQKLLAKLNHCRIRGVSNNWFKSYTCLIVVTIHTSLMTLNLLYLSNSINC